MNPLEPLVGRWRGTSTLHDPHTGKPDGSPSALTGTSVLGGRFVRLDYTWAYQVAPQEGSMLVGFEPKAGSVSAHWIDSWHTGTAAIALAGTSAGGALSVRGTYPAPPGPDWGWRIDLATDGGVLRVVMFNVWPADQGGKEELAVEAVYSRAAGCPVVRFEIGCQDRERSERFYAGLFGWDVRREGAASMVETGWLPGHLASLGHEPHHYATVYVEVDDLPAALARAESLGGRTLVPPVSLPTGSFAWFADPDGTHIGLWKPKRDGS
jgi:uncharacterized protein